MQIRPIRTADAAALVPLCAQLGYPATQQQLERRLVLLVDRADQGLLCAVSDDGGLVGWLHVQTRRVVESDPFAEICGLVVDDRRRGAGIGGELVAAAERWAAERGYLTIRVRSNVVRTDTHRFYEHHGYAVVKSQISFAKTLAADGHS